MKTGLPGSPGDFPQGLSLLITNERRNFKRVPEMPKAKPQPTEHRCMQAEQRAIMNFMKVSSLQESCNEAAQVPWKAVHPALPIVYSSGKNERERLVTEMGREGGRGGERGRGREGSEGEGGEGESRDTQKNYSPGG